MPADQLVQWLQPGLLGFYTCCEVTLCSLLDRAGEKRHNLYTIFSFGSEDVLPGGSLTAEQEIFGENLELVVEQDVISLDQAAAAYGALREGRPWLETPRGRLELPAMEPIPPVFVPIDSTVRVPLNRILKNNFCGGSMVLEFFGEKQGILNLLEKQELQRALERVRALIPIDLVTMGDHLGNVVFQLPAQVAFCQLLGSEEGASCTIRFDKRVGDTRRYSIQTATDLDHLLVNCQMTRPGGGHQVTVPLGRTGGPFVISVLDLEKGIPVLRQTTSMMRTLDGTISITGSRRGRTIVRGDKTETVQVNSGQRICVSRPEVPWKAAMGQRRYQNRLQELMKKREFIPYQAGTREKGLLDLRAMMDVRPQTRVCLWDPYLSAKDLLDTWYYTTTFGLELRAITSRKAAGRTPVDQWMEQQRQKLRKGSNQYGIQIQWRTQRDDWGEPFHDRFLILLPPDEETPQVWSLGTSVNGFGKNHHILQQVSNPGYIADAFEDLWDQLADEACLVWDSRKEGGHGR